MPKKIPDGRYLVTDTLYMAQAMFDVTTPNKVQIADRFTISAVRGEPVKKLQQNGFTFVPLIAMHHERVKALRAVLDMAISDAGDTEASSIVQQMLSELEGKVQP